MAQKLKSNPNVIKTKFSKGDFVYLIEDDKIIILPIKGFTYTNDTITYSFVKSEAKTLMDKPTIIYREESHCFSSIDEMAEFYLKNQ